MPLFILHIQRVMLCAQKRKKNEKLKFHGGWIIFNEDLFDVNLKY